ncbi:hypothetical protein [Flavobacterium sangjuense]|uniref:Uncharacterized protein n=1 Tax=Flavobacterium sangjuense TaxID=2518177 RepID=A0A4P7PTX2_9FLAO|nr:hypothetical protein [Flavobacterium sangjuense]QBZ97672.1 hypothetical protein GS03_01170 [Flavobacterium sangjuense]
MKKILFLFLTAVMFTSCSTDSDSTDDSFFNLNEGNLWVYKRYFSNDGVNYSPTNSIDSVRVTGDTLINGLNYAKLVHKKYNSDVLIAVEKECLRVDSNGHLVNENGFVYHPGTDSEFYNIRSVLIGGTEDVGSIGEELLEPFTTTIEGIDYFVYSYYGIFSPNDPSLPGNYIFYQYKEGLGLVCQRCAAVAGPYSTEDRLIYYELN